MDKALLQTRSLHRSFGGVHAVKDVTFHVPDGAIKAVIGPNGARKDDALQSDRRGDLSSRRRSALSR